MPYNTFAKKQTFGNSLAAKQEKGLHANLSK
jgi:hypothetical protein